ncbi:hypothetical protein EVAR_24954_1 [Eumeta japonica]|uniref:Uncharacterized protein n=1 Tax=Eumeta variegata TaxID=151549 RepID=A0A4C2A015_EUMVA|nr:hypothetical protein EVAR_24954_1 [Eumeta japonica]
MNAHETYHCPAHCTICGLRVSATQWRNAVQGCRLHASIATLRILDVKPPTPAQCALRATHDDCQSASINRDDDIQGRQLKLLCEAQRVCFNIQYNITTYYSNHMFYKLGNLSSARAPPSFSDDSRKDSARAAMYSNLARNFAAVKFVTKMSQWRKIRTRWRRRKGWGFLRNIPKLEGEETVSVAFPPVRKSSGSLQFPLSVHFPSIKYAIPTQEADDALVTLPESRVSMGAVALADVESAERLSAPDSAVKDS